MIKDINDLDFEHVDITEDPKAHKNNPQEENKLSEEIIIISSEDCAPHSIALRKEPNTANEFLSFKWNSKSSDPLSISSKPEKPVLDTKGFLKRNPEIDDKISSKLKEIIKEVDIYENEYSGDLSADKILQRNDICLRIGTEYKNLTVLCLNNSAYNRIEDLISKAIKFFEICGATDFLSNCYDLKGEIHRRAGRYNDSLIAYETSKTLKSDLFGEFSSGVAMTLYEISTILLKLGRSKESQEKVEEALGILKLDVNSNKEILLQLNLMRVTLLIQCGKLKEAEALLEYCKSLSTDDNESMIAKAIESGYLDLYIKRKDNLHVKEILKKMYKSEMERTTRNPIRVARILRKLGSVDTKLGNFNKAVDNLKTGLELLKEIFPGDHPEVASIHYQLADSYLKLGRYEKSEEQLEKSLKMNQRTLGPDHPTISSVYHSFGNLYYSKKMYDKSEEYYTLSMNLDKLYYEEDHCEFAETYKGLADVFVKKGEKEKALEYYLKCQDIKKKMYGDYHIDVIKLNNLINGLVSSFRES